MSIGALSWVMQVWLGISRKSSRRLERTTESITGQSQTSPGPRSPT